MPKLDLKKDLKHLYNPSAKAISVVDVPPMQFLMIDGHGDPNTAPVYVDAVQALYALAYGLKFRVKHADPAADFAAVRVQVESALKLERAQKSAAKRASDVALALHNSGAKTPAAVDLFLAKENLVTRTLPPFAREAAREARARVDLLAERIR